MAKPFKKLADQVLGDPVRRERVHALAQAMRDAVALAELRESRGLTQTELAAALEQTQANVSRVERQRDLYLSTLADYVRALGGELEVNAVFDGERIPIGIGK